MPAANLPPAWVALAEAAGIRPSANAIALAAGIDPSALSRNLRGATAPTGRAVEAIARALRTTPDAIAELFGIPVGELGWWSPPIEAHQMTADQREAIGRLVILLGKDGQDAGTAEAEKTRLAPPEPIDRHRHTHAQNRPVTEAAYKPHHTTNNPPD